MKTQLSLSFVCLLIFANWNLIVSVSSDGQPTKATPSSPSTFDKWSDRAEFIRNMTIEAWSAYVNYSWGAPAHSIPGASGDYRYGHTIIDSLTTLWVMNLTSEFAKAEAWIGEVNPTTLIDTRRSQRYKPTHSIGGLLSAYALTGQKVFLVKAKELAEAIRAKDKDISDGAEGEKYTDNTPPRLALTYFDHLLNETLSQEYGNETLEWPMGKKNTVEIQSFLESSGRNFAMKVKSYLQAGEFGQASSGALFKAYMGQFERLKTAGYIAEEKALGLAYCGLFIHDWWWNGFCSLGASFALAATAMPRALGNVTSWRLLDPSKPAEGQVLTSTLEHWRLAEAWTRTCSHLARSTRTGFPPESFFLNPNVTEPSKWVNQTGGAYHLTSEDAESLFTLWRFTGKEEYREEAWRLAQAINQNARDPDEGPGFFGSFSVNDPGSQSSLQYAEFLSGTLKYLYLNFREDILFPLDKWVFDSMGHPFPICGTHERYPAEICK